MSPEQRADAILDATGAEMRSMKLYSLADAGMPGELRAAIINAIREAEAAMKERCAITLAKISAQTKGIAAVALEDAIQAIRVLE